jgi:hypothetical protein
MNLCHDTLANMFQTNFAMIHHYRYSLSELEDMMPWEREIYTTLLVKHIKEENERLKQQKLR